MYAHPVLTAAIAGERRRDLIARADACRLARSARLTRSQQGRQPRSPGWRATAAAAAAAVLAITVLLLAPALSGHSFAGSWSGNWSSAVAGGTYHRPARGVHYSSHGNWISPGVHWG